MTKERPRPISEHKKLTKETLVEQVRSHIRFERNWSDATADFLTSSFGTVVFLLLNLVVFAAWFVLNTGWFGFLPFDPFPFGLLTMAVSLEAIVLAVIVLISQNRQSKIADIRQKMDFEIDVRSEEEVTKILQILEELRAHSGLKKARVDADLVRMEQPTDIEKIREALEAEEGPKPR